MIGIRSSIRRNTCVPSIFLRAVISRCKDCDRPDSRTASIDFESRWQCCHDSASLELNPGRELGRRSSKSRPFQILKIFIYSQRVSKLLFKSIEFNLRLRDNLQQILNAPSPLLKGNVSMIFKSSNLHKFRFF